MVINYFFLIYVFKYLKIFLICSVKCIMCLFLILLYFMFIYFGMGYDIFCFIRVKLSFLYFFVF